MQMTATSVRAWSAFFVVATFIAAGCRTVDSGSGRIAERPGAETRRSVHANDQDGSATGAALTQSPSTSDPGSLLDLSMSSKVGVLLDEVPDAMRDRTVQSLVDRPQSFWVDRAKQQVRLAAYRLVFRNYFYRVGKKQLPLPPESVWEVALDGAPVRETTPLHDTVTVKYHFHSTLLASPESPGVSEPNLATVGGTWDEPFVFPVDPELLMQRTGFSCMDEAEFPLNSVDSEEADSFYDQDCRPEKEASLAGCHQSALPKSSCQQALKDKVGAVNASLHFERLAWDAALADRVRVGPISTTAGADMAVVASEFHTNRTVYRYVEPNGCEMAEQCVGGPGWRKVIQFATTDRNTGNHTLDIGAIDYYLTGAGGPTLNDQYHIFEYSACHKHYHFMHYGSFSIGNGEAATTKRGFCLQSTARFSNVEVSPLYHNYGGCEYQGVAAGWVDQYKIGLPCQWVDVTGIDTSNGPQTRSLTFHSNPDGFLCEGTPVVDANGNPVFEPTSFKTADGQVVSRQKCNFAPNWDANNVDSYSVSIPTAGEGYVTQECTRGQIGHLRNCGFKNTKSTISCTPGASTTVKCSLPSGGAPQVARLCDYSAALRTGIPCTFDSALASSTVAGTTSISFTCPAAKSATEPGGAVSLYTGPVLDKDTSARVSCKL